MINNSLKRAKMIECKMSIYANKTYFIIIILLIAII